MEELAVEVLAQLPDDRARREVTALVEMEPQAWPGVRDPGSVEEIREAFGKRWIQYMPNPAGAIEVGEIGWVG